MQEKEILDIFKQCEAYQQGHFKLSSGLHSGFYLQCAKVLQDPVIAERLCRFLAHKMGMIKPDIVIGPAMGGIVISYEMARVLGTRSIFSERDKDGKMALRRGFVLPSGSNVLIAEDVLTTGKSIKEVLELMKDDGISVVGVACLIDRSVELVELQGIRVYSLLRLNIPVYKETDCPLCKEGIPIVKPGSRMIV
ncbi:orotate phosphoribosyltransferase [Candidatus Omnitrophus magneticus]|uniref:Orotate phosphoribosyltransferase n=1 Tax=Candidatus Omnitrophus magneticus TaxID=1609969 RepID=A0A0F0CR69_9BACT|nr:orotate phosphoribosyltransferase [Candidatus Omnitrophus magneticus]